MTYIDHLTHNVHRGRMHGRVGGLHERLFNFREIRYFDIEGQVTGVKSKAMTSPAARSASRSTREGKENPGQIQEYLDMYKGEGIQHIAMGSDDLYRTVDGLRASGVRLLDTIDTYYELVDKRIPGHGEPLEELHKRKILIDGKEGRLLLQIFSENQLGPIFFEFIQRKWATTASATATSRPCSRASSSTRSAAAYSRHRNKPAPLRCCAPPPQRCGQGTSPAHASEAA